MKRPILVALVGYIIGILWGYTLKISIVFFWLFFCVFLCILRKFKYRKKKLVNILLNKKIIFYLAIFSILSNTVVIVQNNRYDNLYGKITEVTIIGTVVSNKEETEYKEKYKIKVETLNGESKFKNTNLIFYLDKKQGEILEYGDKVRIKGEYKAPEVSRNDKGFNQKEYLKTEKVYGSVYADKVEILQKKSKKGIFYFANRTKQKLKENVKEILPEETGNLLIGILLGEKNAILKENLEYFRDSNLYHLLAVSGAHVSYLTIGVIYCLEKTGIHKKGRKILCIIILIFFMILTGLTPSVVRACIVAILVELAFVVNRKPDSINNISFSMLLILLENPFALQNLGLQLSYLRNNRYYYFLS